MYIGQNNIGPWHIGSFRHDPSDDSLFWEERNVLTGVLRLGNTGPHRDGIYVDGNELVPPGAIHIPTTPSEARRTYFEVAYEVLRRLSGNG